MNIFNTAISKGVYFQDDKKVNGLRKSKAFLCFLDIENNIYNVSFNEYKKLSCIDTSSEHSEKEFISGLIKQVSSFRDKVEYNKYIKENTDASFIDKVEKLISFGAVYNKSGLKL